MDRDTNFDIQQACRDVRMRVRNDLEHQTATAVAGSPFSATPEPIDILMGIRTFVDLLPPAQTGKDIKLMQDEGGANIAFIVSAGPRAGIYFIDRIEMDAFISRIDSPVLTGGWIEGHKLGGLKLVVADSATWLAVVPSCLSRIYDLVDEWLQGKPWPEEWQAQIKRVKP